MHVGTTLLPHRPHLLACNVMVAEEDVAHAAEVAARASLHLCEFLYLFESKNALKICLTVLYHLENSRLLTFVSLASLLSV